MKNLLLSLTLLLCIGQLAYAQGGGGNPMQALENATPEEMADRSTTELYTQLGLSEEQSEQVYEIQLAFFNTLKPAMQLPSQQDKMRAMRDAAGARDQAMKGVLTQDQYKKFQAIQEQRREQMRSRMGGRGGGGF